MIQHEFIAIDEGHATLLHVDEREQAKNWTVPIGQPAAEQSGTEGVQSTISQMLGAWRMVYGGVMFAVGCGLRQKSKRLK